MAQRQDVDVGAQADALGARRDLHQHEQRIEQRRRRIDRRHALLGVGVAAPDLGGEHQMLRHPDRLEAERLGADGDIRHLLGAEHEERDADLHEASRR